MYNYSVILEVPDNQYSNQTHVRFNSLARRQHRTKAIVADTPPNLIQPCGQHGHHSGHQGMHTHRKIIATELGRAVTSSRSKSCPETFPDVAIVPLIGKALPG